MDNTSSTLLAKDPHVPQYFEAASSRAILATRSPYSSASMPFGSCLCTSAQVSNGVDGCAICGAKWRLWRWKYTCGLCELSVCSSCASEVRMLPEAPRTARDHDEGDGELVAKRVCDLCCTSELQGNSQVLNPTAAFAVLDRNVNYGSAKGKMSTLELKKMLSSWGGADLSHEEVEDLVDRADLNGNGSIDYAEFVKWMDMSTYKKANAETGGSVDAV